MNKQRHLRNFLIFPRYQLKYVFWLTSTGLLLTAINSSIFYYYIKENYDTLVELLPMTDEVKHQLYSELHQIVGILAVVSLFFLSLVALIGIVISHKTAGPLYHFKRIFAEIESGKQEARVHLRPGDDWIEIADCFNRMMDSVTKKK